MLLTRARVGKAFPCRKGTPNGSVSAKGRCFTGRRPSIVDSRRSQTRSATSSSTDVYRWPEWSNAWRFLSENGLQSVDATRAQEMVQTGKWVLVDTRPFSLFEKSHAEGALSIPLFDDINWTNASPMAYVRAVAYLVNGVSPVVPNEQFVEAVTKAKGEGKGLIFYCETGGTMTPSTNFMYGKESRSLKACYRTLRFDDSCACAHLEGGLYGWYQQKKPIEGEYDERNAGKSPNIAKEPDLKDTMSS